MLGGLGLWLVVSGLFLASYIMYEDEAALDKSTIGYDGLIWFVVGAALKVLQIKGHDNFDAYFYV